MELIRAKKKDWKLLLAWRNDPLTRKNSVHTELIGEEEHKHWFFQSLENSKRKIFLVQVEREPIGMLRLDEDGENKIISWVVAPQHRGKGYAKQMLKLFTEINLGILVALIKEDNIASIRVAEFAGFSFQKKQQGILTYKKTNNEDRQL